jgi:two-component system, chemotaxis family, chemotaxis protein CheY
MKRPQKILIIDDSTYIRMSATKLLKEMEFDNVDAAEDGKVGLEKFRLTHPDIVLLDGIMPELDGLTVLKEIKKERPGVIVIISSSISARETILEFKTAGADSYLLKPYEREKFNEVMTKAVSMIKVA